MAAVRVAFPIGLAFLQDDPMPPDLPPSPGNNQPPGQHKSVSPAGLIALGIGALVAVVGATLVLAEWSTKPGISVFDADLSGLGRTVGLIAAAAIGVPAAVLAYHRQRALDTSNRNTADQHEHKVMSDNREHRSGTERNLRERYTTCAEQLGHDSPVIRLAGVYALASLADDWHDFGNDGERQVCVDLLCAYLRAEREPTSPVASDGEPSSSGGRRPDAAEENVRSAIVGSIRTRTQSPDGRWTHCTFDLTQANLRVADLRSTTLRGATLFRADLTNAILTDADLTDANLFGASLTAANLAGADLTRADLTYAWLTDATLTDANLAGADLTGANLPGADLTRANLTRANPTDANPTDANPTDANLVGANPTDANLVGANLTDATLTDANLTNANLVGANLTDAVLFKANLTGAILDGAILDGANLINATLTDADLSSIGSSKGTDWTDGSVQRPTSPLEAR